MTLGYQRVSIDHLSREAGVSKETIYRHFADKQQLFRAAMRTTSDEFAVNFAPLLASDDESERILIRSAQAIRDRNLDDLAPNPSWLALGIANSYPDLSSIVFHDYYESITPLGNYLKSISSDPTGKALVPQFGILAVGGLSSLLASQPPKADEFGVEYAIRLFMNGCLVGADDAVAPNDSVQHFAFTPPDPLPPQKPHIANLMEVAKTQFFASGYLGTSLDEIGQTAKVGRGTLYRHCGNKEGLFRQSMLRACDNLIQQAEYQLSTGDTLHVNLQKAGLAIAATIQGCEMVSLYRTVSEQMRDMPDLAQAVHELSHLALQKPLIAYLQSCMASGQLNLPDSEWGAYQFATLALGSNHYLMTNPPPSLEQRQTNVERAIQTFLRGNT